MTRRPPPASLGKLEIHRATAERWADLEELFGPRGACAGCWCMWWRLQSAEFRRNKGDGNRRSMKRHVESGRVPGLLAYADGRAIGWISIAPREEFPRLERSRTLARVDDRPVWSIVCFFVARPFRRLGLTVKLLEAAVRFAREHGATVVEGYPSDPRGSTADAWLYTGLASSFEAAGFEEVARRSATRPIFRRVIRRARPATSAGAGEPMQHEPRSRRITAEKLDAPSRKSVEKRVDSDEAVVSRKRDRARTKDTRTSGASQSRREPRSAREV